jgi:hypothetical protein
VQALPRLLHRVVVLRRWRRVTRSAALLLSHVPAAHLRRLRPAGLLPRCERPLRQTVEEAKECPRTSPGRKLHRMWSKLTELRIISVKYEIYIRTNTNKKNDFFSLFVSPFNFHAAGCSSSLFAIFPSIQQFSKHAIDIFLRPFYHLSNKVHSLCLCSLVFFHQWPLENAIPCFFRAIKLFVKVPILDKNQKTWRKRENQSKNEAFTAATPKSLLQDPRLWCGRRPPTNERPRRQTVLWTRDHSYRRPHIYRV